MALAVLRCDISPSPSPTVTLALSTSLSLYIGALSMDQDLLDPVLMGDSGLCSVLLSETSKTCTH